MKSVDAAIRFVRKGEPAFQATTGLGWIDRLCRVDDRLVVDQSYGSNEWLLEIRPMAESCGTLPQWQQLVDATVVGGNSGLAGYST